MEHELQTTNQNTGVANFEPFESLINKLVAGIAATKFDVTTGRGIAQAKEVRLQVRTARINLDKAGKTAKRNLNTEKKRIDSEVDRLTALAMTGETPLHDLIRAEEDRKAEEKRLRDEAEQERKTKIQLIIQGISSLPANCHGKNAADLTGAMEYLEAYEVTDFFAEFTDQAHVAKDSALVDIKAMLDSRLKQDAEDAERAAEAAQLVIMKAEQDERQRVLDCQQAEIDKAKAEQAEDDRKNIELQREADSIEEAKQEEPSETADELSKEQDDTNLARAKGMPDPGPAATDPTAQGENAGLGYEPGGWMPKTRRLKKDILNDILELCTTEPGRKIELKITRIELICEANLKAAK